MRADLLGGDLRLLYLLWLTAVEADAVAPDEAEPLPGIGPITPALETFAQFFGIDADLVAVAAERPAGTIWAEPPSSAALRDAVAALPDSDKVGLLTRLAEGDPHVMSELRALVRDRVASEISAPPAQRRTVAELRTRAEAIRHAFEQAEAERMAAEQKKREEEEARTRRVRLDAIARRGERVWREIETEIERRNPSSYDRAAGLLLDLRRIAEERGAAVDFTRRLRAIRERHARKERFIERLKTLG